MRVNSILDVFGAILLLAAIAVVVRNPGIVNAVGGQFNTALRTAVNG